MVQIHLKNISKYYSGARALQNVNLEIHRGEVHALAGENGAGKSTLMKILSGVIPYGDYEGDILSGDSNSQGEVVTFANPAAAEKAGIAIIHQELSAFPHLTVGENIFSGSWPSSLGVVNWDELNQKAHDALKKVGASFSALEKMQNLSNGDQQLVEIAKALLKKSKVLILDEPTSSLSPKESQKLFELIRELRSQGVALVYISHRMEEIFGLCDRVTVLRDGTSVSTKLISETSENHLISQMVGRDLQALYPKRPEQRFGEILLSVKDFVAQNRAMTKTIGPVNFEIRRGEILGLAGLLGAGRTEFTKALLGDSDFRTQGRVEFKGEFIQSARPGDCYQKGIGWLSEDRKRESLLPTRDLNENAGVLRLTRRSLASWVHQNSELNATQKSLKSLNTNYKSNEQKIVDLSGGNQQKVILARILQTQPELIILDEPTRGVDVGAKYEIYELLFSLVKAGKAILLISSDLPELLALSDRAIVFAGGRPRGELNHSEFSQEKIMRLAVTV